MIRIIERVVPVIAFAWASCASALPITATDIVTVGSTEWAQPDLFTSLAWSDINTVCPSGVCGSGSLGGFDMAGWTWASTDDANNLFNHYIGFAALGPGPDSYRSYPDPFITRFKADGWRYTDRIFTGTLGRIADQEINFATMTPYLDFLFNSFSLAETNSTFYGSRPSEVGAFFHRPSAAVPGPATLPLFGLALVVLGLRRGKLNYS